MSNAYLLADGSPRYGRRTGASPAGEPASDGGARVEEAAEGASKLGLDEMAAAIGRRQCSAWADAPDPIIVELRKEHAEELTAARALVKLHLGSQRQWLLKAQAVRDRQLAATMRRRRASGGARQILVLRLTFMAALIALPTYLVAMDRNDVVKLLVVGALCFTAALVSGRLLTTMARVPLMPAIRGPWLKELREDIVNATLVAILQNSGAVLDLRTVAAGRRGWNSIQAASKSVAALHP